jgi:hypothetical protein
MKPTPQLDRWSNVEGFTEARSKSPELLAEWKEDFNREGVAAFIEHNPTFPQTEPTAQILSDWLTSRDLPLTRASCEYAWSLLDLGTLSPIEPTPEPQKPKPIAVHAVAAAQVAKPTEEEQEVLEQLKDVPYLSDAQRKARFAKLRREAIASRIARRTHSAIALVG